MKKITGLLHVTFAYLVTVGAAWATLQALGESPIWDMFWADIAATIAIFVFSRLYKNSSFYDAYWSVIPPLIALYWLLEATASGVDSTRAWLVVILVWLWGHSPNGKLGHLLAWAGTRGLALRPYQTNAGNWDALADFSAIHLFSYGHCLCRVSTHLRSGCYGRPAP